MGAVMAHKDFRRIVRRLIDEGCTVKRTSNSSAVDVMNPGGQLLIRLPSKTGTVHPNAVKLAEIELKKMGYLGETGRMRISKESKDIRRGRVKEEPRSEVEEGDDPDRTDRAPRHVGVIQVSKGKTRGSQPPAAPPRGRYYYQREWAGRVRHEIGRVLRGGTSKRDFAEWAIMVADEKGIPFPTYKGKDPAGERDIDRLLRSLDYLMRRNGGGTSQTLRFWEIAAEEHLGDRRSLKVDDIVPEPAQKQRRPKREQEHQRPKPEPRFAESEPKPEPAGIAVTGEEFEEKFGRSRETAESSRDPDAALRRRYVELLIRQLEEKGVDDPDLMERIERLL